MHVWNKAAASGRITCSVEGSGEEIAEALAADRVCTIGLCYPVATTSATKSYPSVYLQLPVQADSQSCAVSPICTFAESGLRSLSYLLHKRMQ